jgi:hypothetical protein
MKYNLENLLTRADYEEAMRKIAAREDFEIERGTKDKKIKIYLYGRKSDNGIWRHNYLWSHGGQCYSGSYVGFLFPHNADVIIPYEKIIDDFYRHCEIERDTAP